MMQQGARSRTNAVVRVLQELFLEQNDAARAVANDIRCNPMRAKVVDSAESYRWSGLGTAPTPTASCGIS